MNKVFNTPFENSLRVLILLNTFDNYPKTTDMITALDFCAVYGKRLGIAKNDLHGENAFALCEYAARRELINKALKDLAIRGLISIKKQASGFNYLINKQGKNVVSSFDTNYAKEYQAAIIDTAYFTSKRTEQELVSYINEQTMKRTGGKND